MVTNGATFKKMFGTGGMYDTKAEQGGIAQQARSSICMSSTLILGLPLAQGQHGGRPQCLDGIRRTLLHHFTSMGSTGG